MTMASIPKVLHGQSDSTTGEEITQPVTVEHMESILTTEFCNLNQTSANQI